MYQALHANKWRRVRSRGHGLATCNAVFSKLEMVSHAPTGKMQPPQTIINRTELIKLRIKNRARELAMRLYMRF